MVFKTLLWFLISPRKIFRLPSVTSQALCELVLVLFYCCPHLRAFPTQHPHFRVLKLDMSSTELLIPSSPTSVPLPAFCLSGNGSSIPPVAQARKFGVTSTSLSNSHPVSNEPVSLVNFTFRMCPKSGHFSQLPLGPPWCKPPPTLAWVMGIASQLVFLFLYLSSVPLASSPFLKFSTQSLESWC